eukprot:gnl/Spiro4/3211_TR1559_c0_g1_i1.p1 gnl/Spiro4/3211_TR1559_c0_g1~~gnl/Spiro4/3211_TR1559_c0_g1_i1.p1  ORF type:complete len:786 (-),score=249.72 gnl/Spiro4/3211_TR1559_c0_g1_i1:98-2455(-)
MAENERKRRLPDAETSAAKRAHTSAPREAVPKPDDLLAVQNKRQVEHIAALQREIADLNSRVTSLTNKQKHFDQYIGRLNSDWNKLEDDLSLLMIRVDGSEAPSFNIDRSCAQSSSLLARLLQCETAPTWDEDAVLDAAFQRRRRYCENLLSRLINAIEGSTQRSEQVLAVLNGSAGGESDPFAVLRAEFQQQQQHMQQLQNTLSTLHNTVHTTVHDQLEQAACERVNLQRKISDLQDAADAAKIRHVSLTRQSTLLQQQLEEARTLVVPMLTTEDSCATTHSDTNGTETSVGREASTMSVNVSATAALVAGLRSELEAAQNEANEARALAARHHDEIERLKAEITLTAHRNSDELNTVKTNHSRDVWAMWNRAEGFRVQLEKVEGEKAHHAADGEVVAKTLRSEIEKQKIAYEAKVQFLEQHAQKLQEEAAALHRDSDALARQQEMLKAKSNHSPAFYDELNVLAANFKRDKQKLKSKLKRARASEAHVKQEMDQLLARRTSQINVDVKGEALLRTQLQEALQTCKKLEQLGDESKREIAKVKSDLDSVSKEYEEILEQNLRLCGQLREKDDANAQLVGEQIKTRQTHVYMAEEKGLLLEKIAALERQRRDQDALRQNDELRYRAQNELLVKYLTEEKGLLTQRIADESRKTLEMANQRRDAVVKAALSDKRLEEEAARCRETMAKDSQLDIRARKLEEENASMKRRLDQFGSGGDSVLQEELRVIKQGLNCSVCSTRKKDTILTKCFHMFCRHCVNKNLETRLRRCPTCKRPFGVDDTHAVYL